jgi:hypothetical protein
MQQLPDLSGLRDEVIMPKESRNVYDHAFRSWGARVIEVDTVEAFHAALGPRTALVAVLGTGEARGPLRLEAIAAAAHKLGVPVIVDAAAELPRRPDPYLTRGADLVAYSGGKTMRGPQCAGLLLGRKDLVWAAFMNGAPHHAVGRMLKVGKKKSSGWWRQSSSHGPRDGRRLPPVDVIPPGHQRRVSQVPGVRTTDAQGGGRQSVSDDDHRVGSGARWGITAGDVYQTAARRRAADHVACHRRWLFVQRASAVDSAWRSDAGGPAHRRGAAERAEGHSEKNRSRRPAGTLLGAGTSTCSTRGERRVTNSS